MNSFHIDQQITLNIHGIGSSGEGVGYYEGYTIFVDGALPGETVEVRLFQCQKKYGRAELVKIIIPSSTRVEPPCPLFGKCGGCQLMHVSYTKQLEIKQQRVIDALQRIGKFQEVIVAPCLPSPTSLEYRNKIQLPARNGRQGIELGFYARSSHDLVDVERCYIHSPLGEKVYQEVREIIQRSGIKAFDPETGQGELRHLLIKSAINTQEALVILVTNTEGSPLLSKIAADIMLRSPLVKGVIHNLHKEHDNIILGKNYTTLKGSDYITELLCGLNFAISPASFFQVNPQQAEQLYAKALEFADLKGNETILDTYCGVGTLSLIFAREAKHVIGVECVAEAVHDARRNAKLNSINNVEFVCATAEKFIRNLSNVDVLLLNPPRKGCDPSFLESIGHLSPKKLVYISCDPATLARDLHHLNQFGYKIDAVQPYDMFPQTAHVECVVRLSK